jgi:hypothetical protein
MKPDLNGLITRMIVNLRSEKMTSTYFHIVNKKIMRKIGLCVAFFLPLFSLAQTSNPPSSTATSVITTKKARKHELYFSWGYNTEWYTHSSIGINQPALGNAYTFVDVYGHDHEGWNHGIFNQPISIPQYNYRVGYIFNEEKGLGVEINFDHTKFIFGDNQMVQVRGQINGKPVNGKVLFADSVAGSTSSSYYYLNNGANFLLFNIVKRWPIWANKKQTIRFDGLGKFGVGPVIPHVQDKFFDQPENDPHFQFGGWNVGVEGDLKATFFHYVFLEYGNKLDYAHYSGLQIYAGTARQSFGCYEMILNLGLNFPIGKRTP